MKMTNLKKRMLKASVTLGLVFGATLFAVQAVVVSAESIGEIGSWPTNTAPEPPKNSGGANGYVPIDSSTVTTKSGAKPIVPEGGSTSNYVLGYQLTPSNTNPSSIYMNQTLDLTKKFTHKADIYFGSSSLTGDGVSFVMAKDMKSTLDKNFVLPGSNMGIWGAVSGTTGNESPAKTAVPQSFAIVMDTKKDKDSVPVAYGAISNIDQNVNYGDGTQYVGYGYPGQSTMYVADDKTINQQFALRYNNTDDVGYDGGGNYQVLKSSLYDGSWHRFEVSWTPDGSGGGEISYKLYSGSSSSSSQLAEKTVTWSASDVSAIFGAGTTELNWGYIGSAYNVDASSNPGQFVSFVNMGDVDVTLDSVLYEKEANTVATQTQKGQEYRQYYDINMGESSTTWPASGDLNLVLSTNKNYKFVTNGDGKVPVYVLGKKYLATPTDDQHVEVNDIPAIDYDQIKSSTEKNAWALVEASGTDASLTDSLTTIVMGGGSTIRQAQMALPVPQENLSTTTNILIPSFTFGSYGITQFMTGFTDEGTATTSKDNQLAVTTDGNTSNVRMTVALNPVDDLAPDYNGGKVHLKFDFGGNNVDLTDDGTEKQLFSESTIPDTSVGKTPVLTVGKVPNVTTGAKNASLTWTVAVTPPVAAATK
jgi:hypothetical protein